MYFYFIFDVQNWYVLPGIYHVVVDIRMFYFRGKQILLVLTAYTDGT